MKNHHKDMDTFSKIRIDGLQLEDTRGLKLSKMPMLVIS